jgi:hypothetical protein
MPRKSTKVSDNAVTAKDYEKQIKQLVDKGKKDKKIDQRDIFAIIPDTPDNIDVLDQLYAELTEASIEVIAATEPIETDFSDVWAVEEDIEEEVVPEDTSCLTLFKKATPDFCAPLKNSTRTEVSNSPPTPLGGFARRLPAPSPIRRARFVFRCIWWRQSTSYFAPSAG